MVKWFNEQKLLTKILIPVSIGSVLMLGLIVFYLNDLRDSNLKITGLNTCGSIAKQVVTLRGFYTKQIVGRAKKAGMKINYDFEQKENTIPLPATFTRHLGEQIEKDNPGFSIRLFSRFPFPNQANKVSLDKFEEEALDALEKSPDKPFFKIVEYQNRLSMRYTIADIMSAGCVSCHNSHPETPKNDWKIGDVRGAIEVIAPLENINNKIVASSNFLALTLIVGGVFFVGAIIGVFYRFILKPIGIIDKNMTALKSGNQDDFIEVNQGGELGKLSADFVGMSNEIGIKLKEYTAVLDIFNRIFTAETVNESLDELAKTAKSFFDVKYLAYNFQGNSTEEGKFIAYGLTQAEKDLIAHPPEAKGLLGLVIENGGVIRLDDMRTHPKSEGFPHGHPEMKTLLATGLEYNGVVLGNLYLSEKQSGENFTQRDEDFFRQFAQIAALAIYSKKQNIEIKLVNELMQKETNALVGIIAKIAQGKLNVQLPSTICNPSLKKIISNLRQMIQNLSELVGQVQAASSNISNSAQHIKATTSSMSDEVQNQTSQVSDVAAGVEEMATTINENARITTETSKAVQENDELAKVGGDIVKQSIDKIKELTDVMSNSTEIVTRLGASSNEIGEIISVINEIADQTNLLALNAAIEAARAGEQGRGFAVVADEVRKLAERTTQATTQIAEMIKNIQIDTKSAVKAMETGNTEVYAGLEMVNKAGAALQDIVSNSANVTDMIQQIATASEEQATTSSEMSRQVETISNMTNQSSENVMSIATEIDQMSNLAIELGKLVARFETEKNGKMTHDPTVVNIQEYDAVHQHNDLQF